MRFDDNKLLDVKQTIQHDSTGIFHGIFAEYTRYTIISYRAT